MKFFMEFNRECKFRPDLVTETLNKSSFHFVQGQIEQYKVNIDYFELLMRTEFLYFKI